MKRLRPILVGLGILAAVVAVFSLLLAPTLGKKLLLDKAAQALKRPVSLEALSFNPLSLAVGLKGLAIGEGEGKEALVAVDEVRINLAGLASLRHRALVLDELALVGPRLRLVRYADGTYNFSDLIPPGETKDKEEKKGAAGFSLNNITVSGGALDFDDRPVGVFHRVRDLQIAIPFISTLPYQSARYVEPRFSAVVNGDLYVLEGRTRPFSPERETSLEVDIQDLDLPYYLKYLPMKTAFAVPSAKVDAKFSVSFLAPLHERPTIRLSGRLVLREVKVDDLEKRPILRLPRAEMVAASLEPLGSSYHIASLTLTRPEVVLRRNRGGRLQVTDLIPGGKGKQEPARKKEKEDKAKPAPAPSVRVDRLAVDGAAVSFADDSTPEPVRISLSEVDLLLEGFTLAKGSKAALKLSLSVDKKGTLAVKGPVSIDPLDLRLDVALRRLPLRPLEPYLADKVLIRLARGALSATGVLEGETNQAGQVRVRYRGQASVADFACRDRLFGNDLVTWRALSLEGMDVQTPPLKVHIRKIGLRDYFARIIINPDGSLNLQGLTPEGGPKAVEGAEVARKDGVSEKAAPAGKAKEASFPEDIKVGRVDLEGGTVDFTDHFIKPNYTAKMLNLKGSVIGLSSEEIARAAVDLRGNLERGADIFIRGRANPLSRNQYADISMQFKEIELVPVTPYTLKYLGHPILKGKLTFDVSYLVEQGKLNATHKIFVDQLTLGDRVEGPEVINAPVSLGVALLKDRHGQINLDIPVSGSLDDPQFELWPIVWQVIKNIFVKALTAPFSLLASLAGGGEELSYVEFEAGSAELTPEAVKKLNVLAKAMYDKPNVRLDIAGRVDPEKDPEALKRKDLERKVKGRKLDDLLEAGKPAVPVEEIKLGPGEYERYLRRVYGDAKVPKPRNFLGIAKDIPPAEMERILLAHTPVTEGDLKRLALRRAEAVKAHILKAGPVEEGRLFLVADKLVPEKKEKVRDSRVDFRLGGK